MGTRKYEVTRVFKWISEDSATNEREFEFHTRREISLMQAPGRVYVLVV